jgi:hypothetical protein
MQTLIIVSITFFTAHQWLFDATLDVSKERR